MRIINNFQINRSKSIIISKNYLISSISKFCNQKKYFFFLKYISDNLELSVKCLERQSKIILFKNFKNRQGKFNSKFKLKNIFISSIKFILIYFYLKLNTKKNNHIKKKMFELIVDDVNETTNYRKFLKLSNKFKTAYLTSFDFKSKKFFNLLNYKNLMLNDTTKLSFKVFFNLFFFTIIYSFKLRNNLFPFVEDFYKNYFKYENIFGQIISKYLIQDRHFNTNEIKNYLFKKHGGKYTAATQRNILQLNGIGMFIFCDILFTLGKKSAVDLRNYGGDVKTCVPVGSLAMEYNYYDMKKRKKNTLSSFDLLVFCSDHLSEMHSGYSSYYVDYYLHYEWIAKFAQKNPNVKIGLKMKRYIKDLKVKNIFSKLNNVKFIFMKDLSFANSYYYGENAKVICTWSSTLAYEFFGDNKACYFIDPGNRNISFLPNKNFIKKFKLPNYSIFEKTVLRNIFIKNRSTTKYKDYFCMNSKTTSQRIAKYLLNLK